MPVTRLDFTLPELFRIVWASAQARSVWEARINQIRETWPKIERLAVALDIKPATLQACSATELPELTEWALKHDLVCVPLGQQGASGGVYQNATQPYVEGSPWQYRVVIANPDLARLFLDSWREKDNQRIGMALGFPECCRDFFERYWVGLGWGDLTLPQASADHPGDREDGLYKVSGPIECNTLLRWLGLRLVSHLPCSFDCSYTEEIGRRMGLLGIESGYVQEMDWLTQILNWPTQWTSLHGVATITTPVFRLIVDSTAIAEKQIVQRDGPMYPDEGARGVEFPFKELHALHVYRKDEYTDNGFSSRDAMDKAHEPILQLVTEALSQESGAVREGKIIDLGCGNGALLEKIVLTAPWLKPCGVEKEKIKCDRAARRLTAYAPEFHHGSIYDEMLWAPPYLVALMSVERLLEAPKSDLIHLLMRLRDGCNKVILYSYSKERDFTSELASDFFKLIVGYQNELSIAHLLKPKRKHD